MSCRCALTVAVSPVAIERGPVACSADCRVVSLRLTDVFAGLPHLLCAVVALRMFECIAGSMHAALLVVCLTFRMHVASCEEPLRMSRYGETLSTLATLRTPGTFIATSLAFSRCFTVFTLPVRVTLPLSTVKLMG
jgi:hypothetical protein